MKAAAVILFLVLVALLSGCFRPMVPVEPWEPDMYSFCDASRPLYPRTLSGAKRFVADTREMWTYVANVGAQYPQDSCRLLSGDCDDFAIMLAYYLQEYFGFDTFVTMFRLDGVMHACTFVLRSSGLSDFYGCGPIPVICRGDVIYDPVDWNPCPGWVWSTTGHLPSFEWYELAGNSHLSAD